MQLDEHGAFDDFVAHHPEGTRVRCRVVKVCPYGAFCELTSGVEGLLLVVDFEGEPRPMTFPDDYPRVGDLLDVTIEYINREAQKIRLTQRRPV